MSAYIVAQVNINDPEQYKKYTAVTPGVIKKYGGRFVVRGGDVSTLEGDHEDARWVVLEFEDAEAAKAFYYSPEYTEARKIRESASKAKFILLDGYDDPT
tara:strand:- start:68 stop:367 length:300 start_codon:yes stop_codon:yes gene_type:complete